MNPPIGITSISSISPLGTAMDATWQHYLNGQHFLQQEKIGSTKEWVARLTANAKKEIMRLRNSNKKYEVLDDTVLFAIYASRNAVQIAGWGPDDNFGVNIGSSRGATGVFENYYQGFISESRTVPMASPSTTLGNISSWVAHDLQTTGPEISHSITCSTALHALLNGIAWIQSGMAEKFLVGGSEAPLTAFTIAQMKALKIYSQETDAYPSKALDLTKKKNSMVLGEGAVMACLEKDVSKRSLAIIEGAGYATELLEHSVSISTEAKCFQRSMKMALSSLEPSSVDVIVMHAPGTIQGDLSEYKAIEKIFGSHKPLLTSNKWKTGHTLGASGLLSLEMAILMLQHQVFIPVPYNNKKAESKTIRRIMVNAVGFGGNAVSILIKHPL
ncbi:beta-ketoacyl synthase N-terminal-like domain-containing protein [uncultured Muriicola sp.]|uniref:beta-ketoacyl synthase N-terminal-like domain-containing protein n=1 Tax=uncultured Muriicola sp. TaxID=1583102 RepID=UPI00262B22CB|nr:beta-ketoacyl synthase N-terminal-like domain-containing protein [uncultured Muriicola sp.]